MAKKVFRLAFIIILVLLVGFSIFVLLQIHKLKPEYTGQMRVVGVEDTVSIARDDWGMIHIEGKTTRDVIFASGYVAAQERLWQMELVRRLALGRLSEVFGDTTRKVDRLFLTLGIDSLVEQMYPRLSEETKQWLNWYSEGVNAYIEETADDPPLEFVLMRLRPEKWTPRDCLLQTRIMAWFLNFNWKADLLYGLLQAKLPPGYFKTILPDWKNYPTILADKNTAKFVHTLLAVDSQARAIVNWNTTQWGSNSWVIAPQKTTHRAAILANDPHLGLTLPSIWIEMHLKGPEFNVSGFSFPGSPGIVIGRNEYIAWGETNGMIDDSDYFVETVDTVARTYLLDGKPRKLTVFSRLLRVKDKSDEILNIYATSRGPIFNTILSEYKLPRFLSFRWTGFQQSDEVLTFIHLARAQNWDDFREALSHFTVPAQNFVFASRNGDIGYYLAGRIPVRSYGKGLVPVRGDQSANRWQGWIPFEDLPHEFNPKRGWIVTANNKIETTPGRYLSELWEPPYRAERIIQMLQSDSLISLNRVQAMQHDVKNLMAREILPVVLAELPPALLDSLYDSRIATLLVNWNYEMSEESVAASIYEVTLYYLIRNIFLDEMGEDYFKLFTNMPNFYLRIFVKVFSNAHSPWFDDRTTSQTENRRAIITKSFLEAIQYLQQHYGNNLSDWEWGEVHQLLLKHSLGVVKLTELLFNRGPFPVGGSGTTVNVGTYLYKKPFTMVAGASMRMIVDWSEPGLYRSVLTGGNSGNFLSDHYDDQIELWLKGQYKKVGLTSWKTRHKQLLIPVGDKILN